MSGIYGPFISEDTVPEDSVVLVSGYYGSRVCSVPRRIEGEL